jgi:hypothetical protein
MKSVLNFLGAFAALSLTACHGAQTEAEVYHDRNVTVKQEHAPPYPFNVHGGVTNTLTVAGKDYPGVLGMLPCYLTIPKSNLILFVTKNGSKNGQGVIYHIVDLESKSEIAVVDSLSSFGGNIGSGRKPGEDYTDYIDSAELPDKLILATSRPGVKTTYVLNLKSKKTDQTIEAVTGENGRVISSKVFVNGVQVNPNPLSNQK